MSTSESPPEAPPTGKPSDSPPEGEPFFSMAILMRWFLIPAVVVAVGVTVVGLIAVVTTREKSPTELLFELRPENSETRRWQAAYGLSAAVLSQRGQLPPGFVEQVIHYLDDSVEKGRAGVGDPRFRQFLALTLLNLGDRAAIPVLQKTLSVDADAPTRIAALTALSELANSGDGLDPVVVELLLDSEPAVRKAAVYAAGKIGGASTLEPLRARLEDSEVDVRWNAALFLARRGDDSGVGLLARMVDRTYVRQMGSLDWDGETAVVRNALVALGRLQRVPDRDLMAQLANEDKDSEVRRLASAALQAEATAPPPP